MKTVQHRFVELIPENVDSGILYISMEYATAVHRCACGCDNEVVTPFSPNDWKFSFNGKAITLYPSIGNWSFPCRSHYWITENQIITAPAYEEKKAISTPKKKGRKRFLWPGRIKCR